MDKKKISISLSQEEFEIILKSLRNSSVYMDLTASRFDFCNSAEIYQDTIYHGKRRIDSLYDKLRKKFFAKFSSDDCSKTFFDKYSISRMENELSTSSVVSLSNSYNSFYKILGD